MTKHTKGGVMKVKGSRRLVARLGLALAVTAIAVPSATAMTMNSTSESGGSVRLYADDLHAPLVSTSLLASNVRTDAATVPISRPAFSVRTDAATVPISRPAFSVRTDAATVRVSVPASNVRTDAASFRGPSPITNAQLPQEPTQLASASSDGGIDWSVAAIGAALGAFGLMLLIGVVYFTGRHHRSRLAAT
ncbi:MAG: hypothetical protein E6G31_05470 [Actinobacteria bacterium]|nr:MAG: hypothetical protein E6G31_05470 [Actinomycetota bacterium]